MTQRNLAWARLAIASLAAAAILLAATAAPVLARGGGGGGGHGFGGGFGHSYGGGFGHSYGGYRSYGYGGYYHPYYHRSYYGYGGYGGYGYYHSGYYGGYGSGSMFVLLWIIGIIAALWFVSWLMRAAGTRRSLTVVTLVLDQGERYTQSFARFAQAAHLDTPGMRSTAAHELLDRIGDHDIVAAYVHTLQTGTDSGQLGAVAKQIWQTEMDEADVQPDVVNVVAPEGRVRAQFAPTAPTGTAPQLGGCCLFSMIAVASGPSLGTSTDRSAAVAALQHLHSAMIDSFYFYFTPSAGQSMPRTEAIDVLEKISGFR